MMVLPVERLKGCGFRPRLAQTLGVLVLLPVLVALGVWQLERADEKTHLLAELEQARTAAPVPIQDLKAHGLPRRARASGRFAPEQILLDNRVSNGHAGYEHLAPLLLDNGGAVLVDLGWVPMGGDRRVLPGVHAPAGHQRLTGLALEPSPPLSRLSDRETFVDGWPLLTQTLEPARLAARLGYPLLTLVLYPDGTDAQESRLAALTAFPPARHRAYALQWLAMAAILIGLYLRHGLKRGGGRS